MSQRIAVIDIGTNTFNLLVAEGLPLQVLHSEEVGVFLGKGGIEQGMIVAEAMQRAVEALDRYAATARAMGCERVQAFGTSALRNARNAQSLIDAALARGIDVSVVPGEEEAALILDGARQAVPFGNKPVLVMDIGGGSIEFILATSKALMWKQSFELGVTRLLERFRPGDPMTIAEHLRIAEHLDARLEALWAMMDRHWPTTIVGCAGSFDSLAAIAGGGGSPAPELALTDFDRIKDDLLLMDRERRLAVPGLPAYRVDTLPLALVAIERVVLHGIERIRWSPYALKEGAAARLLAG